MQSFTILLMMMSAVASALPTAQMFSDLNYPYEAQSADFENDLNPTRSASSLSLSSFHVGDIGNITSDAGGTASSYVPFVQPAGNSGSRIANGVLGWKNGTTFPYWYTASSRNSAGKKAISVVAPLGSSTVKGLAIFTQDGPSSPMTVIQIKDWTKTGGVEEDLDQQSNRTSAASFKVL
ncbi:hypothetical protein DFJ73DRAFT_775336 [Zopfochytrium polystomum]|nr:hypothetical protein DFJ73DRAFT_775336 [Zopfochytrium polystomum]